MLRRLLIVLFATLLLTLGIGQAQAAVILFETTLAPEIAGSIGEGEALVTFDTTAHTLVVSTTFSDLTGTTTVAHIHCCVDPPGTVGVATFPGTFPGFPAGVSSGAYVSPSPIDLTLVTSYTGGFLATFGGGPLLVPRRPSLPVYLPGAHTSTFTRLLLPAEKFEAFYTR